MRTQDILSPLEHCRGVRTVIVCIGNRLKGDDAAGSILYDRLAGRISANLIDAATVPENYIQTIIRKEPRSIIVVDAVDFGQPPGAVGLFENHWRRVSTDAAQSSIRESSELIACLPAS